MRVGIGDFHKASGLWVSWFFVIIIVTSLWYLLEFGIVIEDVDANTLVTAAKQAFADLRLTDIFYPRSPDSSVIVMGRTKDIFVRDRANRIFLDPVDAVSLKFKDPLIAWCDRLS